MRDEGNFRRRPAVKGEHAPVAMVNGAAARGEEFAKARFSVALSRPMDVRGEVST